VIKNIEMHNHKNTLKISEFILVALVWLVIIAAPFFMNDENNFEWQRLFNRLEVNIPIFLVFILNRFILVPYVLNKKKRLLYIGAVLGVVVMATFGSYIFDKKNYNPRYIPPLESQRNDIVKPGPPPHVFKNPKQLPPKMRPPMPDRVPPFLNVLLFSLLIVGFDTGLMTSFRLAKTEREKARLEKENIENQLAFLRNQISPHFFMNTLNNIHAQIDIDSEEAKESIIKLSKLMRHILYESEVEKISIKKEMEFIENYVGLMKLRFPDKVRVNLEIPALLPDIMIPPILFISFIENAFKHGVSYNLKSFIDIKIGIDDNQLTLYISNSIHKVKKQDVASGIGLVNTIKRLNLLYKDDYLLDIKEEKDTYTVELNLPL